MPESRFVHVLGLVVGLLELGDIDLVHLIERLRDAGCPLWVRVLQHLVQDRRNDLPGEPKPVFQPPALTRLTAFCQLLPELIDFFLRLAVDGKRNGLGELERGPSLIASNS